MLGVALACPRDHYPLTQNDSRLSCAANHGYPVIDGIPILLVDDASQTHGAAYASLRARREDGPYFVDSLGCTPEERDAIRREIAAGGPSKVDPVISYMVAQTNGLLYRPVIGKLSRYPIPELRLDDGDGRLFLDIGCNWGRWSIAAARKGYRVVGIDPSLGAVAAARRLAERLEIDACYIVADARYLPFPDASFDIVFSYSVLQHFAKENVKVALREIARMIEPAGTSFIQMPNAFGIRSLQHQVMRGFRPARDFEIRYWTPRELLRTFETLIGPTDLSADGYFGLGIQPTDVDLLPFKYRVVVRASEKLRTASLKARWMARFADSVYLKSLRG